MDAEELAQKATQLQNELKAKGKNISIIEAVNRLSGKYLKPEKSIAAIGWEELKKQDKKPPRIWV